MMEHYYPNSNWLNLRRDVFEKLQNYKTENFIPTWEQTIEKLLSKAENTEIKKSVVAINPVLLKFDGFALCILTVLSGFR